MGRRDAGEARARCFAVALGAVAFEARLLPMRGRMGGAGAVAPSLPLTPPPPNHPPRQTRSFTFIDDCVEGVLRLMFSDCDVPINLGSTEMVSMNE